MPNIRHSGIKNKNLTEPDKLAYGILQRYYKLVEHENNINKKIHGDKPFPEDTDKNINTTGKKTLTDLNIEGQNFKSFDEFKKHTETIINDLIPENIFTLESFSKYIVKKANNKKISLDNVPILDTKYPILVSN